MCPLSANVYGVDFLHFKIRDYDSGAVIFEVSKEPSTPEELEYLASGAVDDSFRAIRYDFSADFLNLQTIGTSLEFKVGPREMPNFRMIERHYFGDQLLKSYDFTFGFCIPNSTNSWEAIYSLPPLTPALKRDIIARPYESRSDSFYFVGDTLIMHNKAEYAYFTD